MPRSATVVRVFVASPSDVLEERDILEASIGELNRIWSETLGVILELVRWETHTRPAFGADPQAIINTQIGDSYDIFIGILWSRFGTPTPRAQSGTLEEFRRAIEITRDGDPEVMVYFKDASIPPSKIDVDQLKLVKEFKNSISDRALYSVFEDAAAFQSSLRAHLSVLARKYSSPEARRGCHSVNPLSVASGTVGNDDADEDLGFLDYIDAFNLKTDEMVVALNTISSATSNLGGQLEKRTKTIRRDGDQITEMRSARNIVSLVSEDMELCAGIMRSNISLVTTSRIDAMNSLTSALAIYKDFGSQDKTSVISLHSQLVVLLSVIFTASGQTREFRSIVANVPRINREINKARRAMTVQIDLILTEFDNITHNVVNIIESIDRMLKTLESVLKIGDAMVACEASL